MTKWQPIETAPKDGTPFFAIAPGYEWPEVLRWFEYEPHAAAEMGEPGYFHFADELFQEAAPNLEYDEMTHWMPLPIAPIDARSDKTPKAA